MKKPTMSAAKIKANVSELARLSERRTEILRALAIGNPMPREATTLEAVKTEIDKQHQQIKDALLAAHGHPTSGQS